MTSLGSYMGSGKPHEDGMSRNTSDDVIFDTPFPMQMNENAGGSYTSPSAYTSGAGILPQYYPGFATPPEEQYKTMNTASLSRSVLPKTQSVFVTTSSSLQQHKVASGASVPQDMNLHTTCSSVKLKSKENEASLHKVAVMQALLGDGVEMSDRDIFTIHINDKSPGDEPHQDQFAIRDQQERDNTEGFQSYNNRRNDSFIYTKIHNSDNMGMQNTDHIPCSTELLTYNSLIVPSSGSQILQTAATVAGISNQAVNMSFDETDIFQNPTICRVLQNPDMCKVLDQSEKVASPTFKNESFTEVYTSKSPGRLGLSSFLKNGGNKLFEVKKMPNICSDVKVPINEPTIVGLQHKTDGPNLKKRRTEENEAVNQLLDATWGDVSQIDLDSKSELWELKEDFSNVSKRPLRSKYELMRPEFESCDETMELARSMINGTNKTWSRQTREHTNYALPLDKVCSCPTELGGEAVPVEQLFVRDGQMFRIPDVTIIRWDNLEFYAFVKENKWHISLAIFFREIGKSARQLYEGAMIQSKNLALQVLGVNEKMFLQQKCQLSPHTTFMDTISINDIKTLSKNILKHESHTLVSRLEQSKIYQKVLGSNSKCSSCGLPWKSCTGTSEVQQFVPIEILETDVNYETQQESNGEEHVTIGLVDIYGCRLAAFQFKNKTYISLKDLIRMKISTLQTFQCRLSKLKYTPIAAPDEIEKRFTESDVCKTLWSDITVVRCTLCMGKHKFNGQREDLISSLIIGDYNYEPMVTLFCKETPQSRQLSIDSKTLEIVENSLQPSAQRQIIPSLNQTSFNIACQSRSYGRPKKVLADQSSDAKSGASKVRKQKGDEEISSTTAVDRVDKPCEEFEGNKVSMKSPESVKCKENVAEKANEISCTKAKSSLKIRKNATKKNPVTKKMYELKNDSTIRENTKVASDISKTGNVNTCCSSSLKKSTLRSNLRSLRPSVSAAYSCNAGRPRKNRNQSADSLVSKSDSCTSSTKEESALNFKSCRGLRVFAKTTNLAPGTWIVTDNRTGMRESKSDSCCLEPPPENDWEKRKHSQLSISQRKKFKKLSNCTKLTPGEYILRDKDQVRLKNVFNNHICKVSVNAACMDIGCEHSNSVNETDNISKGFNSQSDGDAVVRLRSNKKTVDQVGIEIVSECDSLAKTGGRDYTVQLGLNENQMKNANITHDKQLVTKENCSHAASSDLKSKTFEMIEALGLKRCPEQCVVTNMSYQSMDENNLKNDHPRSIFKHSESEHLNGSENKQTMHLVSEVENLVTIEKIIDAKHSGLGELEPAKRDNVTGCNSNDANFVQTEPVECVIKTNQNQMETDAGESINNIDVCISEKAKRLYAGSETCAYIKENPRDCSVIINDCSKKTEENALKNNEFATGKALEKSSNTGLKGMSKRKAKSPIKLIRDESNCILSSTNSNKMAVTNMSNCEENTNCSDNKTYVNLTGQDIDETLESTSWKVKNENDYEIAQALIKLKNSMNNEVDCKTSQSTVDEIEQISQGKLKETKYVKFKIKPLRVDEEGSKSGMKDLGSPTKYMVQIEPRPSNSDTRNGINIHVSNKTLESTHDEHFAIRPTLVENFTIQPNIFPADISCENLNTSVSDLDLALKVPCALSTNIDKNIEEESVANPLRKVCERKSKKTVPLNENKTGESLTECVLSKSLSNIPIISSSLVPTGTDVLLMSPHSATSGTVVTTHLSGSFSLLKADVLSSSGYSTELPQHDIQHSSPPITSSCDTNNTVPITEVKTEPVSVLSQALPTNESNIPTASTPAISVLQKTIQSTSTAGNSIGTNMPVKTTDILDSAETSIQLPTSLQKDLMSQIQDMEMKIKKYLEFSLLPGNPPVFKAKRFKDGAENVFPALFLPRPDHWKTRQLREQFMISAASHLTQQFIHYKKSMLSKMKVKGDRSTYQNLEHK